MREVGQAFSFDGVNDYVSIPHDPSLQSTQITVGAWIKANPAQSYTHYLVVDKSHGWTDATGWVLQGETSSGRITFSYGNGVDFPELYSTTNLLDDNWHFVTGTLDGSDLKIYVDGTLEGSLAYSGTPAGNSRSVNIGASWGGGTFNRFFNGLIDEVTIFNRALTASEIQSMYVAGNAGMCNDQRTDEDNDTFTLSEGDCDDTNPNIFPGASELCDALDNDCDGTIDEGPDCWPVAQNCDALYHEVFMIGVPNPRAIVISPGGQYGNYMYATSGQNTIYRVSPNGTAEVFAQGRPGNGNFLDLVFDNTRDHRYGGYLYAIVDYFGGPCYARIDRILPNGTVESFVDGCGGNPVLLGAYGGEIDDQGKFGYNFFLADFEVDEFGRSPSTIIQISPAGGRSPFYSVLLRGVFGIDIDRFGNFDGDMLAANSGGWEWGQGDNSIYRVKPDGTHSVVVPNVGLGIPYDVLVDGLGTHSGNLFVLYGNMIVVYN